MMMSYEALGAIMLDFALNPVKTITNCALQGGDESDRHSRMAPDVAAGKCHSLVSFSISCGLAPHPLLTFRPDKSITSALTPEIRNPTFGLRQSRSID
jgi:hypothetical protein